MCVRKCVSINTGPAVVTQVQSESTTALGDTVNLASRLQNLAEPDKVMLGDATHRLVQGIVEATFAGELQVKGTSELQKTYKLDAIRRGSARFDVAVNRGLSAWSGERANWSCWDRGSQRRADDFTSST